MGRKPESNYIEAARAVLGELGGGPIASRDLVAAAQERGLVGNGTWVYHNFLRKVRDTAEFDTSKRGYISLVDGAVAAAEPGEDIPVTAPLDATDADAVAEALGAAMEVDEVVEPGTNPLEVEDEVAEENPFETTVA